MILFPAIDLKDGACVRLEQGEMDRATVFNEDPAAQARRFVDAGARWLHLVDLNGAFAGRPVNGEAVAAIRAAVDLPIQLGGGIRDLDTIGHWLGAGITRVILGTVAVKNPAIVIEACRTWPDRIAVGIDARGGRVAVEGWAETSEIAAIDLARRFQDVGVAAIIHTDIDRDGVMQGPNVAATAELAQAVTTPVILSGGVSCLDDLKAVKAREADGIVGVISGRALYDGRLDAAEAIAVLEGTPC